MRYVLAFLLFNIGIHKVAAEPGVVYQCSTSDEVYKALDSVKAGDEIILQGGNVYEISRSFELKANGSVESGIRFTSRDMEGLGRYAVVSTVDGRKEEDLVALSIKGSHWNVSKLEIRVKKMPLGEGYWDTYGFRIGIYLSGKSAHHNTIEDIHIHHTHNAAVAIRNESNHNTFRRARIHDIGEWLSKDYNAHEAEGFYIGSSKGKEGENKAIVRNLLIEDCILGPGILGQYIDIKYAVSYVTVRKNRIYCDEKRYNEEIIRLAGFACTITDNEFIGATDILSHYITIDRQHREYSVLVDYLEKRDVPHPSAEDNTISGNIILEANGIREPKPNQTVE